MSRTSEAPAGRKRRVATLALGAVAVAVVGVLYGTSESRLGPFAANVEAPSSAHLPATSRDRNALLPLSARQGGIAESTGRQSAASAAAAGERSGALDASEETLVETGPQAIEALLEDLQSFAALGTEADYSLANRRLAALAEQIADSPAVREAALDEYFADPDSELGQMLRHALGGSGSPEVEGRALEVATEHDNDVQRLAGLSLLSGLPTNSRATRETVFAQLAATSGDEDANGEVMFAQVVALHRRGPDEAVDSTLPAEAVQPVLAQLAAHPDPRIRGVSHSVIAAFQPEPANQLLAALDSDPSNAVRAEVAELLGAVPQLPPQAAPRLRAVADNPDEALGVRSAAWSALTRFMADDAALEGAWQAFQSEHAEMLAGHTH